MSSAPLTADQMLAALAKWGIKPRFYRDNWRTHNRGNRGAGWGPINGFLVHNFASDISDASSLAYLYNGDNARGMPGPLSQFAIDDAGTVWVIGWGRANHGGFGDPGFVDALAYDRLSLTSDYRPRTAGSVDMNARTYGVEMLYGKAPTQAQRDSVVRLAAALMDAHGYAATSVGGHRESTTQRSDPVGFQMGPLRAQVAALLRTGSTLSKPVTLPKPSNPKPVPEEDDMNIADIVKAVWEGVKWKTPEGVEATPGSFLRAANNKAGKAAQDAAAALAVVRAQAANGAPLKPEQVEEIVKRAIAESVRVTGELTIEPK